MKQINFKILILTLLFVNIYTIKTKTSQYVCQFSNEYKNNYLGGCVGNDNCKKYASFEEAKSVCCRTAGCGGITWSSWSASAGNDMRNFGYQLRAGKTPNAIGTTGENSWVFQGKILQTQSIGQMIEDNVQCQFGNQYNDHYLGGCVGNDNCKSYATLQEAAAVCCRTSGCGGITYSSWSAARGNDMINWGYQMRAASNPTAIATTQEVSWPLTGRGVVQKVENLGEINIQNVKCKFASQKNDHYLGGCVTNNNCKKYATLQDAAMACCNNPECGGITWSSWSSAKGNDMVDFGYQMRAQSTPNPVANTREISWALTERQNVYKQENVGTVSIPDYLCQYGEQKNGHYLGGCVGNDNCKKYETLQEAAALCCRTVGCGGITWSSWSSSAGNDMVNFGYQMRAQSNPTAIANTREVSWPLASRQNVYKQENPGNVDVGITKCGFGEQKNDHYLGGCVGNDNCKKYASLQEAAIACCNTSGCGGITWSSWSSAKGNDMVNFGYQMRAQSTPNPIANTREVSWPLTSRQNVYKIENPGDVTLNDFKCQYGQQKNEHYLGGCVGNDNCKKYATLQEAATACCRTAGCGGITWSSWSSAKGNDMVDFGYQMRAQSNPTAVANTREVSWPLSNRQNIYKQENPGNVDVGIAKCGFGEQKNDHYLGGCVGNDNCKKYASLQEAAAACCRTVGCGGITWSSWSSAKGNDMVDFGYQMRAQSTPNPIANTREVSWPMSNRQNVFKQESIETVELSDIRCSYGEQRNNFYLGGCVGNDNCKKYATLSEAAAACCKTAGCGGITWSSWSSSAGNDMVNFGYQMRASSNPTSVGTTSEISWVLNKRENVYKTEIIQTLKLINYQCEFDTQKNDHYLGGCVGNDNCKKYATLQEAAAACCNTPGCGGVTWSSWSSSKGNDMVDFGYQMRAQSTPNPIANTREVSWALKSRQNIYKQEHPGNVDVGISQCGFGEQKNDHYLGGCVGNDNCKKYATLSEAAAICCRTIGCGGVTWSSWSSAKGNDMVDFGYQMRAQSTPNPIANTREVSWPLTNRQNIYKQENAGEVNLNDIKCSYGQQKNEHFLGGCVGNDNCKKYPSLQEAVAVCCRTVGCGGITWSSWSSAKGNDMVDFGYQMRAQSNPTAVANTREVSWPLSNRQNVYKQENPGNVDVGIAKCGFGEQKNDHYLGGCVGNDNCKKYATLQEAAAVCCRTFGCGGITLSSWSSAKGNDMVDFGYQMRAQSTPNPIANTREVSWPMSNRQNVFKQESIGNIELSDIRCSYGEQRNNFYLGGCVGNDNCKKYATLQEAATACCKTAGCGGITWSSWSSAKGNDMVDFGYQMRASSNPTSIDSTSEISWVLNKRENVYKTEIIDTVRLTNVQCQFDTQKNDHYLGGCVGNDNCKKYATLQEAAAACCNTPGCGGVTWSSWSSAKGNDMVDFGYQMRAQSTPNPIANTREVSWALKSRQNIYKLENPGNVDVGIAKCGFGEQKNDHYLGGCVGNDNCKKYATLSEAAAACCRTVGCGGITWSSWSSAKGNDMVDFGYQMRAQSTPNPIANTREVSWPLTSRQNVFKQESIGTVELSDIRCSYGEQRNNFYLGGCVGNDNCKKYASLQEAAAVCCKTAGCGGITWSSWSSSAGNDMVNFGYQMRASSNPTSIDTTSEISWVLNKRENVYKTEIIETVKLTNVQCQFGTQKNDHYLGGCVGNDNCKKYASLNEAAQACCNTPGCGGITLSSWSSDKGNDMINFGYQMRASSTPTPIGNTREVSWALSKRENLFKIEYPGEVNVGTQACTYGEQKNNYYLGGCVGGDNCKKYATLQEAAAACCKNAGCGGITWSSWSSAKGNDMVDFGYQMRTSTTPIAIDTTREASWVINKRLNIYKEENPGDVDEQFVQCKYGLQKNEHYLGGCVGNDNCKKYATLKEAASICCKTSGCGGITWSSWSSAKGNDMVDFGYQMRAQSTPTPIANTREVSWALTNRQNIFKTENIGELNLGVMKCLYSNQRNNSYLGGCVGNDNCKKYATLQEAAAACCKTAGCGGITWSSWSSAKGNDMVDFGYQMRAQSNPTDNDQTREVSWSLSKRENIYKEEHPGDVKLDDYKCQYGQQKNEHYLGGCVGNDNCKKYATLQEAAELCCKTVGCGGITWSSWSSAKGNDMVDFGYQMRAQSTPTPIANTREVSWALIIRQNVYRQENPGNVDVGIAKCGFGEQKNDHYLGGCVGNDNCKKYATLQEAAAACCRTVGCGGITWSSWSSAKGNDMVDFGYQMRAQSNPTAIANTREVSWPLTSRQNVYKQENLGQVSLPDFKCQYDEQKNDHYLGGCVGNDNCKKYATLQEAAAACCKTAGCGGITWSSWSSAKGNDMVDFGYQMRAQSTPNPIANTREVSWVLSSRQNVYKQENIEDVTLNDFKCQYGQQKNDHYLGGCVGNDNCKKYATLQEAAAACCRTVGCGGITWSSWSSAKGNDMVDFGYQLRAQSNPTAIANTREVSWSLTSRQNVYKQEHPGNVDVGIAKCGFGEQKNDHYLGGCVGNDNCKKYATLQEAAAACCRTVGCGGITWSSWSSSAGNDMVNFGYQMRAQSTPNPIANTREISWALTVRQNNQESNISIVDADNFRCNYGQRIDNHYLGGCVPGNDCRNYNTLQEAAKVCCVTSGCGGVTWSSWSAAKGNDMVNFGYQLRASSTPSPIGNTQENSWVLTSRQKLSAKSECPVLYSECGFKGKQFVVCDDVPSTPNAAYKSLYIPKGVRLTFYSNEFYEGQQKTVTSSVDCDNNGIYIFLQTKSHKIERTSQNRHLKKQY